MDYIHFRYTNEVGGGVGVGCHTRPTKAAEHVRCRGTIDSSHCLGEPLSSSNTLKAGQPRVSS